MEAGEKTKKLRKQFPWVGEGGISPPFSNWTRTLGFEIALL